MVVALLEVVRRWQWVFIRVETELRRLRVPATGKASVHDAHEHADHDDHLSPNSSSSDLNLMDGVTAQPLLLAPTSSSSYTLLNVHEQL